ncbi:MAG: adenylyl-sulfate kinase, partial [Pseudomonadota bacterium]
ARAAAPDYFNLVHIKADVKTCEQRDPKGLYKKAIAGEIKDFTGISAPYEEPLNPDIVIDTTILSIDQSVELLLNYVQKQFVEPTREIQESAGGI